MVKYKSKYENQSQYKSDIETEIIIRKDIKYSITGSKHSKIIEKLEDLKHVAHKRYTKYASKQYQRNKNCLDFSHLYESLTQFGETTMSLNKIETLGSNLSNDNNKIESNDMNKYVLECKNYLDVSNS
eukprot:UN33796